MILYFRAHLLKHNIILIIIANTGYIRLLPFIVIVHMPYMVHQPGSNPGIAISDD